MKIRDVQSADPLEARFALGLDSCSSLQEAAQLFTDRFYAWYTESTVLVRLFVTVPFARLPPLEQHFAREFSGQFPGAPAIRETTDVLTLLGTRGSQPGWNARADSRGHLAIPLISDKFVSEIPMIARVLRETGFGPLLGSSASRSLYVSKWKDEADGLFFIGDARVTTDERGRLIIPAIDFVSHHGVRTVFGFGGPYAATRTFVTAIIFCRETILRTTASGFVQVAQEFKERTAGLLQREAIFP